MSLTLSHKIVSELVPQDLQHMVL